MIHPEHNQREFFRIPPPGLLCTIPMTESAPSFPVLDISIAGLALVLPKSKHSTLEVGATYHDCNFVVPEFGEINVTMLVRNVLEMNEGTALRHFRAGFSYVDVKPQTQARLMRYIAYLERLMHKQQIAAE
jgi:c-di-GMP-binding flagellar brake protein YcgR